MIPPSRSDPLVELMRGAFDRSPDEPGRPSPPATGWRAAAARAARLAALTAIGFLLVVAYRQMIDTGPEVNTARTDLLSDVRQGRQSAEALQRRAETLRGEVAERGEAALSGDARAAELRDRVIAAGLGELSGAGGLIRLTDAPVPVDPVTGEPTGENPGQVLDKDLRAVVNALWALGAEAIAIDGHRLTSTTAIRAAGGAILVDFQPVTSPYEVTAIGPDQLADRFRRSEVGRRFDRYAEIYRMGVQVRAGTDLTVPAAPEPRLRYASPPSPSGGPS